MKRNRIPLIMGGLLLALLIGCASFIGSLFGSSGKPVDSVSWDIPEKNDVGVFSGGQCYTSKKWFPLYVGPYFAPPDSDWKAAGLSDDVHVYDELAQAEKHYLVLKSDRARVIAKHEGANTFWHLRILSGRNRGETCWIHGYEDWDFKRD